MDMIWTPAAKIRAAEADLKEARDLARKYYRRWQETEGGLAFCEDSASYDAKRAKDKLKETQEYIVELGYRLDLAHKAVSKMAGYAPLSLADRIEIQLQKKLKKSFD